MRGKKTLFARKRLWSGYAKRGMGDLRPYGLMQLAPLLLIRRYPPRCSGGRDILAVIGLYLLALLFDLTDRPVFALTGGLVGGARQSWLC